MKREGKRKRAHERLASRRGLTLPEFREKILHEHNAREALLAMRGIDIPRLDADLAGSHGQELNKCRVLIEACGGVCNVTAQSQRLQGTPGFPDLYVHLMGWAVHRNKGYVVKLYRTRRTEGYAFWVEVKVGADMLSPEQQAFIGREIAVGHVVVVGKATELEAYLRQIGVLR